MLVYFTAIWYIFGHLVYLMDNCFYRLGILYHENMATLFRTESQIQCIESYKRSIFQVLRLQPRYYIPYVCRRQNSNSSFIEIPDYSGPD
jgi:hypothetical protein